MINLFKLARKHLKLSFVKLSLLVYIAGFVTWNDYLGHFGFFEYNLIQVRFLSAGFLFFVALIAVFIICTFGYPIIAHKHGARFLFFAALISVVVTWFLFTKFLFPIIPQYLGGARPITSAIIGSPEQISYLVDNFDIVQEPNAEGQDSVQTGPICLVYQNNDYVLLTHSSKGEETENGIIPVYTRIISLQRENIRGFQTVFEPDFQPKQCDIVKIIPSLGI